MRKICVYPRAASGCIHEGAEEAPGQSACWGTNSSHQACFADKRLAEASNTIENTRPIECPNYPSPKG